MRSAPTFGDLLREFRLRAGLSQSELAEKARISEAAVGALERGLRRVPYRSTVSLLAKALALNPEESAALEAARSAGRKKAAVAHGVHNLLEERAPLVGRDGDVGQIVKLLHRSRLVTVTGSGGVGKTRAARAAARLVLGSPWEEAWFVDLAPLIDGDFIASKIATTIRPELTDRAENVDALASALAKRNMLLILDNCEHVVAQAARAADAILEACPRISILATSRERLNVAGEFVYRLPSLLFDPSIDLFHQRVRAADPHITFDTNKLPAVIEIARRLDGIPLAIELTAAQVPALGIETLRARLYDHFSLPSGRRDLPARQQTVNATIEWSYSLLPSGERELLCETAIFAGGFTLAAAEAVCAREPHGRAAIMPLISSLENKSLLTIQASGTAIRYALLESVRAFGLGRLHDGKVYDSVARRHAQWLAEIGDQVESGAASPERTDELTLEFDNVRASLAWSLNASAQEDRALAGHVLTGLFGLWDRMGRHREHRHWVETALDRIDEGRHPLVVAYLLRDLMLRTQPERIALDPIDRALRLCETVGDEIALAKLLNVVAQVQATHGMLPEAEASLMRSHELLLRNRMESSGSYCSNLLARSDVRMRQERFDEARADLATAEAKALALGHRFKVVRIYWSHRARIEYAAGNKQLALEIAQRMLDSAFGSDPAVKLLALWIISPLRLMLGDVEGAVEPLRELLELERGTQSVTFIEVEYAALALALLQKPLVAARLFGRVCSQEQRAPFQRSVIRQDAHELLVTTLSKQLSEHERRQAAEAGALLTSDEAIDEALAALGSIRGLPHLD